MRELSDKELLEKLRDPSGRAYGFNLLVRQFSPRLYPVVRRLLINHDDADDAMQNAWLSVHRNIDKFQENSSLFTWLYRITLNEALALLKKNKRRSFLSLESETARLARYLESPVYFDGDESALKFQKAILTLPPKQRSVFHMRYFDELPYARIAEITGTSEGALKASYHQAVSKIEKYIHAAD